MLYTRNRQKKIIVNPPKLRQFFYIVLHWKGVYNTIAARRIECAVDKSWMQKVIGRAEMIQKRYPDDKDIQQFVMILGGGDIG